MKKVIKSKKKEKVEYETSSGNVFADLGITNAEETLAKSELALQISEIIAQKKLTQRPPIPSSSPHSPTQPNLLVLPP